MLHQYADVRIINPRNYWSWCIFRHWLHVLSYASNWLDQTFFFPPKWLSFNLVKEIWPIHAYKLILILIDYG